jgi:predicted TIM-barrel fold metal-dependent hydrolase
MIVDAHCHVFEYGKGWSETIAHKYLEAGLADQPVWWEPARNWTAQDQHVDIERLLNHMDEGGVDKAVVFGITARPYDCFTSLEYLLEVHEISPDRFLPFHVVDILGGVEARKLVEEAILKHGVKGIKTLPAYNHLSLDDPILYPFYAQAEELGLPLIVHTGSTRLPKVQLQWQNPILLDKVGAEFPRLKLWLAHAGMLYWKEAFLVMGKYPNMVADLSFWGKLPPYERAIAMTSAKHLGLLPRLFWGTDYPFWEPKRDIERWRKLPQIQRSLNLEPVLTSEDIDGLLGQNVARFLALNEEHPGK